MPIFVRAADEKHRRKLAYNPNPNPNPNPTLTLTLILTLTLTRRKLASAGATALETGPQVRGRVSSP